MEIKRKLVEFMNNNNNNNNNLCHFAVSYFIFPCLNSYYGPIFSVVCIAMKSVCQLRHVLLCVCLFVRPSVFPHVLARLPLDGFPCNFKLGISMKIYLEIPNLKISVSLHEDLSRFHCCGGH